MIGEVLELLAHAAVQANQLESARDAYKELIELEPDNNAHVQGYRQVCALMGPAPRTGSFRHAGAAESRAPWPTMFWRMVLTCPRRTTLPRSRSRYRPPSPRPNSARVFPTRPRASPPWSPPEGRSRRPSPEPYARHLLRPGGTEDPGHTLLRHHAPRAGAMGESEAASFYCELAGAGQTTTWEAKTGEFTRQRI